MFDMVVAFAPILAVLGDRNNRLSRSMYHRNNGQEDAYLHFRFSRLFVFISRRTF